MDLNCLPFCGVGESATGHHPSPEGFVIFFKLRPAFRRERLTGLKFLISPYGRFADRVLAFLTR